MKNYLKDIVDMIMAEDYCRHRLNREMEEEAEAYIEILNQWMDETFPEWAENDEACSLIFTAMFYREKWMLANGIAIGLGLAGNANPCFNTEEKQ